MLTPNWNPDGKTLRQFAWLWLGFFLALGLFRAWRGGALGTPIAFAGPWQTPVALWALALGVGIPCIVSRGVARTVYVGMMALTFPIGWVVSHVLLGIVYFGLFTVMGAVFRVTGRDRLRLAFDKRTTTYWRKRKPTVRSEDYFNSY